MDSLAMLRPEHTQAPNMREKLEGTCDSCGLPLKVFGGYQVPKVPGKYCSILCIEAKMFGGGFCGWCGRETEGRKRQHCDDHCQKRADGVQFGNGDRLKNWLKKNAREFYEAKFEKSPTDAQISIGGRSNALPQPKAGLTPRTGSKRKGGPS